MDVKSKLKGGFGFLFLFGDSIAAFPGKKNETLLSFLIPCLLLPLNVFFASFYPPRGLQADYSLGQIAGVLCLQAAISLVLVTALVAGVGWMFRRRAELWPFFEALNWLSLAFFIATIPLMIVAANGWLERDEMDRVFVIVGLYFYVAVACAANRAFRLNWQLAGFIAVLAMLGDQHAWDIVFWANDIPYPWDY